MTDAILVLNAGSSSLKFSLFQAEEALTPLLRGQLEGLLTEPQLEVRDAAGKVVVQRRFPAGQPQGHEQAIERLLARGPDAVLTGDHRIVAAGHRVVHGGVRFTKPVKVSEGVVESLEKLVPLAPLHQPHNLAAVRAVTRLAPDLPQVVCFDTAFHHTLPPLAQSLAIPRQFAEEGVRRYGFHGLSYEYIASALPGIDARAAIGRTVVAHLGNGASLCAMLAGRSVATTMSFTPLDGLMMGTRCGSLDPGVLLYLMDRHGMDARALEDLLYHRSGLLGVSELSSDMRTLLASSDPRAQEAIELFIYRIVRELGSMAAALGGLDALVFTAGIGENSATIRGRVCEGCRWLGLDLDDDANLAGCPRISRADSAIAAWVVPTNEELKIAQHTWSLLTAS